MKQMTENKLNEQHLYYITSQTNYSLEFAKEKLIEHDGNYMNVIKEYMGIPIHKNNSNSKIKSINQEIYHQIRKELDTTMKKYNDKNPVNIDQVIHNLQESEMKWSEKNKN